MSWEHFWSIITDGITYDTIKRIIGSGIVTAMIALILKRLKRFESAKEVFYFCLASFVGLYVLFFMVAPKTEGPQLAGAIQQTIGGPFNNSNDTLVVITMNVLNAGSMQSIVKNWEVKVTVEGQDFTGIIVATPPKEFTFKNDGALSDAPQAITYHSEDNLVDKTLSPIPGGGMATGILYILFPGLNPTSIRAGSEYIVSFEDVVSKVYLAKTKTTARSFNIAAFPGLHTDLVCKAPPNLTAPGTQNYSTPKL